MLYGELFHFSDDAPALRRALRPVRAAAGAARAEAFGSLRRSLAGAPDDETSLELDALHEDPDAWPDDMQADAAEWDPDWEPPPPPSPLPFVPTPCGPPPSLPQAPLCLTPPRTLPQLCVPRTRAPLTSLQGFGAPRILLIVTYIW
eukprot:SAG11_NODE_205_length_12427_cov_8.010140_5_plen_146_part_00